MCDPADFVRSFFYLSLICPVWPTSPGSVRRQEGTGCPDGFSLMGLIRGALTISSVPPSKASFFERDWHVYGK